MGVWPIGAKHKLKRAMMPFFSSRFSYSEDAAVAKKNYEAKENGCYF